MLSYIQQEIEDVSIDGLKSLDLLRLLTIDDLLDGDLFTDNVSLREEATYKVLNYFTSELDGMAELVDQFNYDMLIDLVKIAEGYEAV